MSGALRLYAAPSGAVTEALRTAVVASGSWASQLPDAAATAERVAGAIAAGGAHLDLDGAVHVVAVVEQVAGLVAVMGHGPAGGDDVRRRLLDDVLAPRFGADPLARLFLGPLSGCTFPLVPSVGLLRPFELGLALASAGARRDRDLRDTDALAVATVRSAIERAAVGGHDLVGVLT